MLSPKQIEDYLHVGYVLLPGLIEAHAIEHWSHHFEEIVSGRVATSDGMVVMKDVMVAKGVVQASSDLHAINKIMNFEDDPVLYEYVRHSALVSAVQDLIGTDLYTLVSNVFNKPPGVDGRHPLHQDLRYFRLRPAELIVAAWTAISRATRETGCIALVPGSHRQGLRQHKLPDWDHVNFAFYGIDNHTSVEAIHIEMEPGDTLLFHPLLIHGSGRNRSNDFRRSISTHYASATCESPPPDWRQNDRVRALPPVEVT